MSIKIILGLLTAFAALSTLLLGILGFWFYRKKNAGEGDQAIQKGKQEALHTTEAASDLDLKIEENDLKRKTLPVKMIEELLQDHEENSSKIRTLTDQLTTAAGDLSRAVALNIQQEDMIKQLNAIVSAQWARIELVMTKFAVEQRDHGDCLSLVQGLQEQVKKLTKRVTELESECESLRQVHTSAA